MASSPPLLSGGHGLAPVRRRWRPSRWRPWERSSPARPTHPGQRNIWWPGIAARSLSASQLETAVCPRRPVDSLPPVQGGQLDRLATLDRHLEALAASLGQRQGCTATDGEEPSLCDSRPAPR